MLSERREAIHIDNRRRPNAQRTGIKNGEKKKKKKKRKQQPNLLML